MVMDQLELPGAMVTEDYRFLKASSFWSLVHPQPDTLRNA